MTEMGLNWPLLKSQIYGIQILESNRKHMVEILNILRLKE